MPVTQVGIYPRQRKRGRCWVLRWFDDSGRRFQETCDTKREAEELRAAKMEEFSKAPSSRTKPAAVTLRWFIDELRAIRIGPRGDRLAARSLKESLACMERFAAFVGERTKLVDITPRHAVRFVASIRTAVPKTRGGDKLSPATINKMTRTIRAAFNVGIRQLGYLKANPFEQIRQDRVPRPEVRYVDEKEFASLARATETMADGKQLWWLVLLDLAHKAGLRRDEALHLTWNDVSFDDATVTVTAKAGKGRILPWTPKGKQSRRIPIPESTATLLARRKMLAGDTPYVLISSERLDCVHQAIQAGTWKETQTVANNLGREWAALAKRAGLVDDEGKATASLHDLRRTAITNWARRLPIHVTMELGGHVNMQTTSRYYLKVTEADFAAARAAVEDSFRRIG